MRKIRELGSLPADAFDKYQGLPLSQVRYWYIAAPAVDYLISVCVPVPVCVCSYGRSYTNATRS